MQFPIYHPGHMGDGLTIGLEAVIHVLISHGFSVGVFGLIVLAEYIGIRRASQDWESFARSFIRVTAITITSAGAVSGVGIWFYTSVLAPRAIGSMLRVFFWPWWIEWFTFIGELLVLLAYYYLWDRWQGARKMAHVRLGASYLAWAICSAILIAGIISFMLTSDGWPWSRSFWQAFLNPSFLPHLFLRLTGSFALAGLISLAYLYITRWNVGFRREASRVFGGIMVVATLATVVFAWWYFQTIPPTFKTHAIGAVLGRMLPRNPAVFWALNASALAVLLVLAPVAARGKALATRVLLIPATIAAIAFVAQFEYIREFIRGPYLMPGYMYANQILVDEHELIVRDGMLRNSYWYSATSVKPNRPSPGEYLFGQNCGACHTIGGVNDIGDRVRGRTADGIYVILGHTREMIPWMPPFSGNDEERHILADYLYDISLADGARRPGSRYPAIRP